MALLAALLYYFGWVRAQATYSALGVNPSLLEFSTGDYLQRGANAILTPILLLGLVVLGLSACHRRLVVAMRGMRSWVHNRRARVLTRVIRTAGYLCLALTAVGLLDPISVGVPLGGWLPVGLIVGAMGVGYADHLASGFNVTKKYGARVSVLAAFLVVGAFWITTLQAGRLGASLAQDFAPSLAHSPKVVLYSDARLGIAGPGVKVEPITQEDSRYHFRYEGLRLLVNTGDSYIIAPQGWTLGRDALSVLPSKDARIDLVAQP
jgi:hypothetical protein